MPFFDWKPEYSVGNSEIDAQHQSLVTMINKLYEAMKIGKGNKEVNNIVKEMVDYAKFHFVAEEKMMKEHHYSGFNEHIKEHQAFIEKTHEFEKEIEEGTFHMSIEVSVFLKDWLANHILINDKAYSPMFQK
jgi:hemerythrin-like metal-binding protein